MPRFTTIRCDHAICNAVWQDNIQNGVDKIHQNQDQKNPLDNHHQQLMNGCSVSSHILNIFISISIFKVIRCFFVPSIYSHQPATCT